MVNTALESAWVRYFTRQMLHWNRRALMLTALDTMDDRVRKLWPSLYVCAFNTFLIRKLLSEICVNFETRNKVVLVIFFSPELLLV